MMQNDTFEHSHDCFNEAGAINAGKLQLDVGLALCDAVRFNEAGAINAGKRRACPTMLRRSSGFNEAGAINAGKPWMEPHGDGPRRELQ